MTKQQGNKLNLLQLLVSTHLLSSPTAQANELNSKQLCVVNASFSDDNNNDDDTQYNNNALHDSCSSII